MPNVLEARLTADTSDLKKKLSEAEKLQNEYAKAVNNAQKELAENIKISRRYEKAIEQLNKEFKQGTISQKDYSKQLERLKRDEKETSIETARLRKQLSKLKREQKDVLVANKASAKGFGGVAKGAGNATPTLIEFGRVIQDAPYGIQGVANNIQQLATNFGYLQQQAGGTKGAIKSLVSGFIGPAGILFAISAVTSLLVSYGDELFKSTNLTDKLAKATSKYVGEAKSESISLQQLLKISRDENTSKAVRQKAIDEINDKYSEYLGNLDLESVKTDTVTQSVDNLTKALILKAKVQGLESLITEKTVDSSEDIVKAELDRAKALKILNSEVNKAIKGNSFLNRLIGDLKGDKERLKALLDLTQRQDDVGAAARTASAGVVLALQSFTGASKEAKKLNKDLDNALIPLIKLQEQFKKGLFETEAGVKDVDEGAVIIKTSLKAQEKAREKDLKSAEQLAEAKRKLFAKIAADQIKEDDKARDEFIKKWESVQLDIDPFDGEFLKIDEGFRELEETRKKIIEIKKLLASLGLKIDVSGFNLDQLTALETKLKTAQDTAEVFSNAIGSSFNALSTQIASSLSTGNAVLDAFVGSLVQSLAQAGSALLTSAITEAIVGKTKQIAAATTAQTQGVQIATAAAAAAGPFGIGLLPGFLAATQATITGALASAQIPKFAQGGIVPGGSFTGDKVPAFLNSGELVLNGRQQAQVLMAIASGNVATAQVTNNNDFSVTTVLRGADLLLSIEREKRKR